MKTLLQVLASVVALAVTPIAAGAQQAATGGLPAGITVVATGKAEVRDWTERFALSYAPPSPAAPNAYAACQTAVAALGEALRALGLPGDTVTSTTVEFVANPPTGRPTAAALVGLAVDPAKTQQVYSAALKSGWKIAGAPKLEPRDETAAKDAAYAAALQNARHRAEAIAASDGRHVGKLLNVQPLPTEYLPSLGSLASAFGTLAQMMGRSGGLTIPPSPAEVKQSATFTFELLP